MTLRSRLALLFGLVALAVSAFVGVWSYRATRGELIDSTDRFLEDRARAIAVGNRPPPQRSPDGARPRVPGRSEGLPVDADSIVQVVAVDGSVVASSGVELPVSDAAAELLGRAPRPDAEVTEQIELDGERFRLSSRAAPGGGIVQVARSIEDDLDVLRQLAGRFVAITALATLLASLAGWLIARRLTAPLRRLSDVAGSVARTGDVSVDVPVGRADEIGTLAASFRQMLTTLQTSREQQRRLVHDAGHELRTPLTSLRANVDLLERTNRPGAAAITDEDRADVLEAIRAEMGELTNLFDELIELASDGQDRDAPMEPVDLDDVVRRSVDRWMQRTGRTIDVQSTSAPVIGNAAMLERAVANLVGNAHKFSPPDAPIEIVAHDGIVTVTDHGPGIAPADRERVFDRFYRADDARTLPGSGLGLAIVAQIVEQHHGSVHVSDVAGGGTAIGFSIPLSDG